MCLDMLQLQRYEGRGSKDTEMLKVCVAAPHMQATVNSLDSAIAGNEAKMVS